MDKLHNYFNERYRKTILSKISKNDGPVITISRTTGCDGRQVASALAELLNRKYNTDKWKWADKDIIYKAAREINVGSHRVEDIYKRVELSNMSEMIMAFSGGFISDQKIKRVIKEVVLSMCKEGHVVMVGRGGVVISKDIAQALHVRIVAPFYWRVENVMRKKGMDIATAETYIIETDQKRLNMFHTFMDKKPLNLDYLFDATINRASFSERDISAIIADLYEKKVNSR